MFALRDKVTVKMNGDAVNGIIAGVPVRHGSDRHKLYTVKVTMKTHPDYVRNALISVRGVHLTKRTR